MIELIKKPNINFMSLRKYAFLFSGVLSIIGMLALVQIARGKANMGIDFAGGTNVQIKFASPVSVQNVRSAIEDAGIMDSDIQDFPTENKVLIKVKKNEDTLGGISERIISSLKARFSDKSPVVDSTTEIGPKVGKRLRQDAMWAIIAATIGILIYVAFRFQWSFGIGATISTFHDVLAVIAAFYLLGKEVNLIFISALLMIAGYSLTDTVVVFDRIRENLKNKYKLKLTDIVNASINEVLSRTIIVSLTTMFTALALFLFGGEVIHDFSLAIILGILIGTYSSVFVASPVVLLWSGSKPLIKR